MFKKSFSLIVGITLIVGVLGYMPGIPSFRDGHDCVANLCMAVFLAIYMIKNRWLSLFILWSVFSVLYIRYAGLIHGQEPAVSDWIFSVVKHIQQLSFMIAFYEILKSKITKDNVSTILNVIGVLAILQSVMIALQWSGIWISILPFGSYPIDKTLFAGKYYSIIFTEPFKYGVTGFFDNPNLSGSCLALCFPVFLRRGWWWFIPLILAGLGMSISLGAVIPVVIVSIIWIILFNRSLAYILIPACLLFVAAFMYVTGDLRHILGVLKFSGRMEIWQVYFTKIIKTSPIFGYGLSMGEQLYQNVFNAGVGNVIDKAGKVIGGTAYLHPHNEYIAIASEVGLVGLGLALAFFTDVIRKAITMFKENYLIVLSLFGVIIGLINCGVHFMLHTTPVLIFVCYIAIIEKCYQEKRRM